MRTWIPTFVGLVFASCFSLWGMDSSDSSSSRLVAAGRSATIVDAIDDIGKGGFVGLETPFLSDNKVCDALIRAQQRGAQVKVHLGNRAKANREKLLRAGVAVKELPDLHAKRCLISTQAPENVDKENEAENSQSCVFVGSDNLSYCSRFHKEIMVETKRSASYFGQHFASFESPEKQSKKRSREVMEVTPVSQKAVDTRTHCINRSKAQRILSLAENSKGDDSIDITSMTFDDTDIVEAVEEVYKKCERGPRPKMRFVLDGTALKHSDLLDRLKHAGRDDVLIYIFNADRSKRVFQKFPELQHTKTITRKRDGKQLSIISTGNLTNRSDQDFNIDSYHPDDSRLFRDLRSFNDDLVEECTEYKSGL